MEAQPAKPEEVTQEDPHSPLEKLEFQPLSVSVSAFIDKVARFSLHDGGFAIGRYTGRDRGDEMIMAGGLQRYSAVGKRVPCVTNLNRSEVAGVEQPGISSGEWQAFKGSNYVSVTMVDGTVFTGKFRNFDERCDLAVLTDFSRFRADGTKVQDRLGHGNVQNAYVESVVEIEAPED